MPRRAIITLAAAVALATTPARAGDAGALYERGRSFESSGNSARALQAFRRAINTDPAHTESHRAYQRLMLAADRRDVLLRKYDKLLATDPTKPLYRYLRARVDPDAERRRRELEVVTGLEPGLFWPWYELVELYLARGDLSQATIRCQKALGVLAARGKDDAEVRNTLGTLYMQGGKTERAAAEFQKAIGLDLKFAKPYYNLGLMLNASGERDKAVGHLQKAVQIDPDFAEAHCSLGHLFARAGKLDDAIKHYDRAVDAKPDYGLAWNNLAVARFRQDKPWLAMAGMQKAKSCGFAINPAFERAVIRKLGDDWKAPPPDDDGKF